MTIKVPKEPKKPREPQPPVSPKKYLIDQTNTLDIPITTSKDVYLPFFEVMKVRSQIDVPDDLITLRIDSSIDNDYRGCDCCETYSHSEISRVCLEWYSLEEDPNYQKKLEKYQKEMKKYKEDKASYAQKLEQYGKDMKDYKKKLKEYRLVQMKQEKENLEKRRLKLEADIAKAESK